MLLKRRLRLGGGLLALGFVALFSGHPPPVRGDRTGTVVAQHNLESHQYKDSRKCSWSASAFGCGGGGGGYGSNSKRTTVSATKRHHAADKRIRSGGGGGGGRVGGEDRTDSDLDLNGNTNFDYNSYDGGGGGYNMDDNDYNTYDQVELINEPRDRMMPVVYNPRPMTYMQPPPSLQHLPLLNRQQIQSQYDMPPPYQVPIIECPATNDGFERFACPTADGEGRFKCIDDHVLCDGYIDCPNADDEDPKNCFFFKTTKAHLDILADALLRWARGR
ncbi:Low-density lipoprotein (LDL) receptor class A repeat,Low-density lipoprotein (LDL) receptor class A [Cinara cedri]|uniref:Low-density lipoprotein (LDL) receptor class A repeat,Low-density lipoprotein (LDL) receptor class A n=1 Tax=Cinara cedri TaxID=506608 RepID=A0A5E4MTX5_9HEMI|nr:Low-density lipoprotein (LDL) receptor class A repeat,Low-density lipoprotein (LDL) receptor class A [Cinara cedri]